MKLQMQQIIYLISTFLVFILFILLKKTEKTVSFIKFISINTVAFLCNNMLICFILSIAKIPITLITLAITNFCLAIILSCIIAKEKSVQKYYIKRKDVIAIIILLLIVMILSYINLGKNLDIKYITTDAVVHFTAAKDFYENDELLNYVDDTNISKGFMTGAYVNTGILFKVVEPLIREMDLYKLFIGFDIFLLFLMGILLYSAVEKIIEYNMKFIISMIMIIVFLMGYPLNSFIYGYVYLLLGIIIIGTIINLLQCYADEVNKKIVYVLLLLTNFGLFFSYCIFIPVVYIVEFIYINKKIHTQFKTIFKWKNVIITLIIFIIPIICGMFYFVIPHLVATANENNKFFINIEGYIYRNLWSNFILILPIALMCTKKKNDDTFIWTIFISLLIIFMAIYFIFINKLHLSTYYYYKYNYILWFLLWYGAIYSINTSERKYNTFLTIYVLAYIILAVICVISKRVEITKELFDNDENLTNAFDIYGINRTVIEKVEEDYNTEELELLQYIHENIEINKTNNILLIANPRQECWFDAFFKYKNREDLQSWIQKSEIDKWNNKEYKYILILYKSFYYDTYKDYINNGNLIFQNDSGAIYINN